LQLDNVFNVGSRASALRWPTRGIEAKLSADATLRHLIVFTPPDEDGSVETRPAARGSGIDL
jgi:hypothetical protein